MHCRAGACPRRYLPGYPPGGHAAFLKVASLDFYRKRPRRLRLGRGTAFDVKSGGKTTRAAALDPGPMAAVGCTDRAETGRALPPVFLAILLQALPRLGRHASGLPCKPWEWLRCTNLARRAAVGALPPKYRGGCCGWETARQGCRALQCRPRAAEALRSKPSPPVNYL